jgi:UDPglucose 6-dehydrogenase
MKVTVVGTGYVGLVTGACLANVGNDVLCVDLDARKLAQLSDGMVPFHEPGLQDIVRRNLAAGRLSFTADSAQGARFGKLQFIAVGTPPDEDGSADLSHVRAAARTIGEHMDGDRVVINKSTVPVGTARRVHETIADALAARGVRHGFSVVSNPEFLKEGAAVADFTRPDRIVIGSDDAAATVQLRELYAPFGRNHERLMVMSVRSAEMTKYVANAMLATRISFMNEMALLAEDLGADIDAVRRGIGSDERIGHHFLYAGCGFGGSCFPKDLRALIRSAQDQGRDLPMLRAVEQVNEAQKNLLSQRVVERFGTDLSGRRFAVWGLAFKPNTDDVRDAPSRVLIEDLLERGAQVRAYDPVATQAAQRAFGARQRLAYANRAMDALADADALLIVTEWTEFRSPDFPSMLAAMRQPVVFDGRNLYEPSLMRSHGFEYRGVGR